MEEQTCDRLVGDWEIFQLRGGHRFSTDDLVTAWRGTCAAPHARRLLDLGCGIGSVGLSALHRMSPDATLVGVEAQDLSVALARQTVAHNRLEDRVSIHQGDLRDPDAIPDPGTYDLVTGSPPYIPLGSGLLSPHPQRAACRIELRGSVVDYCLAARRALAPGGRFCFVMAAADPRIDQGPRTADLVVLERWDVVFREGREPLIATRVCARAEDGPFEPPVHGTLVIRDREGVHTSSYQAFRRDLKGRAGGV